MKIPPSDACPLGGQGNVPASLGKESRDRFPLEHGNRARLGLEEAVISGHAEGPALLQVQRQMGQPDLARGGEDHRALDHVLE